MPISSSYSQSYAWSVLSREFYPVFRNRAANMGNLNITFTLCPILTLTGMTFRQRSLLCITFKLRFNHWSVVVVSVVVLAHQKGVLSVPSFVAPVFDHNHNGGYSHDEHYCTHCYGNDDLGYENKIVIALL